MGLINWFSPTVIPWEHKVPEGLALPSARRASHLTYLAPYL